MDVDIPDCVYSSNIDLSGGNKPLSSDGGGMPPEARRKLVLEFIAEHDFPLPPLAIWAGLKRQHRVTFAYRTLQNILSDLVESGDVFRVDTGALRDGNIEPIEGDPAGRKSYYFITQQGRERLTDDE